MGLRFRDALKLSVKSIAEHKGRSAAVVATISVLFGVLMAANFLLNGMEKTLLEAENIQTNGEVYAVAGIKYLNQASTYYGDTIYEVGDLPETIEFRTSERKYELIRERLAETGGEVVGETWMYQAGSPLMAVSLSAAEDLVTTKLAEVPAGKVPVLTPSGKLELPDEFADTVYLREVLYPVGVLPTVQCEDTATQCVPTLAGENPLNYLLDKASNWSVGDFVVVDDGSGKIEKFVHEYLVWQVEEAGYAMIDVPERQLVLKFEDVAQAERYACTKSFLGIYLGERKIDYLTGDFRSGTFGTLQNFAYLKALLALIELGLIVVAVVISTMTFKHLIDQDAATVALYRSLGATTGNIYLIYLLYMLELCLLALVACFVVAGAIVGTTAMLNAEALSLRLQEFYRLSEAPQVYFYSFDQYFWTVVVAVLVVAPLSLAFSTHRFKAGYVARKLKEDV